jgi:hypothetical protein
MGCAIQNIEYLPKAFGFPYNLIDISAKFLKLSLSLPINNFPVLPVNWG